MDLMELGTALLKNQMSGNADEGTLASVLGSLLGGGDARDSSSVSRESASGGLDLGALVGKMMGGDTSDSFTDLVKSWLGDGDNEAISVDQVKELFGEEKINEAASQLGEDEHSFAETLSKVLPDLVDKSSSGGSLLDSVGGLEGMMNMAKKLF